MTERVDSDGLQHAPEQKKDTQPAGGYDPTPIPSAPPGYTVRITFHRAQHLPIADIHNLSSTPYLTATLKCDLAKRHKEDPDLVFRTPAIRRNTSPEWNSFWDVAHIPSSGFGLKIRVYDEDPADHDDRLGNVYLHVPALGDDWEGLEERTYRIKKRMGSKRAYFLRGCAWVLFKETKMSGSLVLSVERLGQSEGMGGRAYTVGPSSWIRHYSPLIGRLTGTKDRNDDPGRKQKVGRYNFQAIQMQLAGPVPPEMYHRYVEFKPFVAGMFDARSPRGWLLNRTLHHQHGRIYNYDHSTLYGFFQGPCIDMTKQFLDFVHYDHGGRIFTYVLTLDARWRFTETGKEFGIDMLSKHSMHCDLDAYIAFSGEFFIRRLKKASQPQLRATKNGGGSEADEDLNTNADAESNMLLPETASDLESCASHPDDRILSGNPSDYEMIIDNDSGTYRPNARCLPSLRQYMRKSLPGLRIVTLDCQADAEKMGRLKDQQRQKKKESSGAVQYMQRKSTSSSISSSDEEDLDEMARSGTKENKGSKLKWIHEKADIVRPGVEVTIKGVKQRTGIGGRMKGTDHKEYSGRSSRAMGGIVGEDGPVRTREKAQEAKRARKKRLHPHSSDGQASSSTREENKINSNIEDEIWLAKPDKEPDGVVDEKNSAKEEPR